MKNYAVKIENADAFVLSKEFTDLEAAINYYNGCVASLEFVVHNAYWYVELSAVNSGVILLSEQGEEE